MPDHVHAMVYFEAGGRLSGFMHGWKRKSSWRLRRYLETAAIEYAVYLQDSDRLWRPKYYDFNIFSEAKLQEKRVYMHANPVRTGLVETDVDWPWSSARWYAMGLPVGVPLE